MNDLVSEYQQYQEATVEEEDEGDYEEEEVPEDDWGDDCWASYQQWATNSACLYFFFLVCYYNYNY